MRGKPTVTCTAKAKSTGERCGRAPIPGGSVCLFHGGGTRKARAAGRRRLAEAAILANLAAWEKQQSARQQALAPWSKEIAVRFPEYARPADLRRVAREMTAAARLLRAVAASFDESEDP